MQPSCRCLDRDVRTECRRNINSSDTETEDRYDIGSRNGLVQRSDIARKRTERNCTDRAEIRCRSETPSRPWRGLPPRAADLPSCPPSRQLPARALRYRDQCSPSAPMTVLGTDPQPCCIRGRRTGSAPARRRPGHWFRWPAVRGDCSPVCPASGRCPGLA